MDTVSFSGELSPLSLRQFRLLIFRQSALSLAAKFVLVVVAGLFAAYTGLGNHLEEEVIFATVVLLIFAGLLVHKWFATGKWWRSMQEAFPFGLSGYANPTQLVVTGAHRPVSWSELTRTLGRSPQVLLVFGPLRGPQVVVPFHRALFKGEAEWEQFLAWATPRAA
jgi:hypothetical protein